MLDRLGCWEEIAPQAQAMTEMIVTDSRTSDPVRPVFLTFDGEVAPGEPFAHMVANKVLNGALRRRAAELGIDIIEGVAVAVLRSRARGDEGASRRRRLDRDAAARRRRRRELEAARHGRHQDGDLGIRPVRHRLHGGARAAAQWPRRGAFPAGRSLRDPAAETRRGRPNRSSIVWTERTRGRRKAGRRRRASCSRSNSSSVSG